MAIKRYLNLKSNRKYKEMQKYKGKNQVFTPIFLQNEKGLHYEILPQGLISRYMHYYTHLHTFPHTFKAFTHTFLCK